MTMSDNIADMLTRIRNGQKSKLMAVAVANSRMNRAILDVLLKEGYIKGYSLSKDSNNYYIDVGLKYYSAGKSVIHEVTRVSKPGRRIYSSSSKLKGYRNNMGIYILSTPKGVLSDKEARAQNVGGEIICKVF